jgi:hypothetical protein
MTYRSALRRLERVGRVDEGLCVYAAEGLTDEQQEQEGKTVVNQDPYAFHDGDKAGAFLWVLRRKCPDFTGSTDDFSLSYAPFEICLRNQNVGCIP